MDKSIALNVKCPNCGTSLMDPYRTIHDKPTVKLIVQHGEERGQINICSFYGCMDHYSAIPLKKGDHIQLFCPHCDKELTSDIRCRECQSTMIPFAMDHGGRLYLCSRWECNKHYLDFDNVSDALRKLYNEYGYF